MAGCMSILCRTCGLSGHHHNGHSLRAAGWSAGQLCSVRRLELEAKLLGNIVSPGDTSEFQPPGPATVTDGNRVLADDQATMGSVGWAPLCWPGSS